MIVHRVFVVFSFNSEAELILFKKTKNMDLVVEKKIAMMRVADSYNMNEIVELFEEEYPCYIVYELVKGVDELMNGKNLHSEDAS